MYENLLFHQNGMLFLQLKKFAVISKYKIFI
jgi:hypothetical protein